MGHLIANSLTDGASTAWGLVTDGTDYLNDLSQNWWFLLVIGIIALLDSVFPVVPSETAVIIGGVAAGQGHYWVIFVIAAGALGAFVGDNLAYFIGDRLSHRIERRAQTNPKYAQRLSWATTSIRERGGLLLITARFIPGGRTMLTVSSGVTHQPRSWFMGWIAVAVVVWATYGAVLGYIFGEAFEDDHTTAFLVAFGVALGINILIEGVRHLRGKRSDAKPERAMAEH